MQHPNQCTTGALRKSKSESYTKKFSKKFSNIFRKSTQIPDHENVLYSAIETDDTRVTKNKNNYCDGGDEYCVENEHKTSHITPDVKDSEVESEQVLLNKRKIAVDATKHVEKRKNIAG